MKRWLKMKLGIFTKRDLEWALANITTAKDRTDFEWQLNILLFRWGR